MNCIRQCSAVLGVALGGWLWLYGLSGCALSPKLSTSMNDHEDAVLSLGGAWTCQLDPLNVGISEEWFNQSFRDEILLPGTTDEAKLGRKTTETDLGNLTREYETVGAVWYQRELNVPSAWGEKRVDLFLERCLWQTQVWIDGRHIGTEDSLTTPHIHEAGRLTPGTHRLVIRVDNSKIYNIGAEGHSYTKHTQSIWNGIVGRIELQAHDALWLDHVQVFPSADRRSVQLKTTIRNETGRTQAGTLRVRLISPEQNESIGTSEIQATFHELQSNLSTKIDVVKDVKPWSEFAPHLYRAEVTLEGRDFADTRTVDFGFRSIATNGKQITLDGEPIFLRGTLDCCIFPRTGYPAMDIAYWRNTFEIVKSYGMNHIRFHSWCPPEAAFTAADREGMYLQVETPLWIDGWMTSKPGGPQFFGQDPAVVSFIQNEHRRILETYSNHPSFCMMGIGNEFGEGNDYALFEAIVQQAKADDPRRLYAISTARRVTAVDDFYVTHDTPGGAARGTDGPQTNWDFQNAADSVAVPVIAHEIGQWVVYPDYREIEKYTGVLKPRNYELFRQQAVANGLEEQSAAFQQASGRLAFLLYKQEIEAMFRTPRYGGFQHLMLYDFPGQHEALVGLLDAFWDSKGITTPEEFRNFCSATVPLMRLNKFVWKNDEILTAQAELAHYGAEDWTHVPARWFIQNEAGGTIASGRLTPHEIPRGSVTALGSIAFPLQSIKTAQHLTIHLEFEGRDCRNWWDVWVYPAESSVAVPDHVMVTERYNRQTREALAHGKRVLLLAGNIENASTFANRFLPVYWSYGYFPSGPGTLGFLCDPNHDAFAHFPTEFHSSWQWYDLLNRSKAFILDETPKAFKPILQPIDDFHRNHKLGAIFETKAGAGKLLVCGVELTSDLEQRPEARQLLRSLVNYVAGDSFHPQIALDQALLERLLAGP